MVKKETINPNPACPSLCRYEAKVWTTLSSLVTSTCSSGSVQTVSVHRITPTLRKSWTRPTCKALWSLTRVRVLELPSECDVHSALASSFFFSFRYTLLIPCGKFGPPHLVTATATATAVLPSPTSACWVFSCFHNPPNSDMDNMIFNMRTWSFLCVHIHMGVGHTDSESAQHPSVCGVQ